MFGTVRKYPDEKKIRWEKMLEEMIAKITVELAERGWPGKVDHVAVKDKRGNRLMLLDVRKQRQISMAQPITLEITAGIRGVWHFLSKEEVSNGVVELWTQDGSAVFPARTTIEDVYGNWSAVFVGAETE